MLRSQTVTWLQSYLALSNWRSTNPPVNQSITWSIYFARWTNPHVFTSWMESWSFIRGNPVYIVLVDYFKAKCNSTVKLTYICDCWTGSCLLWWELHMYIAENWSSTGLSSKDIARYQGWVFPSTILQIMRS